MKLMDIVFIGLFLVTFGLLSSNITPVPAAPVAQAQYSTVSPRIVERTAKQNTIKIKRQNRKRFADNVSRSRQPLSDMQLRRLLKHVGFKNNSLDLAVRIVHRESRNNPMVHNDDLSTGDNSYGLFQINMIGSLGSDRREKFNLNSNEDLFNPLLNAQIAYHMSSRGKNFSAWKCYETGCRW